MVTHRTADTSTQFAGSFDDLPIADVLQTVALSPGGGVIEIECSLGHGCIAVADANIVDAELGDHVGEPALERILMCPDGDFRVRFGVLTRSPRLALPPHVVLMRSAQREDEWQQAAPGLPAPTAVLVVQTHHIAAWAEDLCALDEDLLARFTPTRILLDVVDGGQESRERALSRANRLHERGLLRHASLEERQQIEIPVLSRWQRANIGYEHWVKQGARKHVQAAATTVIWSSCAVGLLLLDAYWILAGIAFGYAITSTAIVWDPSGARDRDFKSVLALWPVLEISRWGKRLGMPARALASPTGQDGVHK